VRSRWRILALVVVATACQRDNAAPAIVDDQALGVTTTVTARAAVTSTRSNTGVTTAKAAEGIEGMPVDPNSLVVGDCFNRYAGLQNYQPIEITTKRACDQAHDAEVFYKSDYAGSVTVNTYPGKQKLTTDSIQVCYENFNAFVGKPYETSAYQLGYFVPSQDVWESTSSHYRAVTCYVTSYNKGTKIIGSVRASGV